MAGTARTWKNYPAWHDLGRIQPRLRAYKPLCSYFGRNLIFSNLKKKRSCHRPGSNPGHPENFFFIFDGNRFRQVFIHERPRHALEKPRVARSMLKSLFVFSGSGKAKRIEWGTSLADLPASALDLVLEHSDLRCKSVVGRCSKSLRDHVTKHLQDVAAKRIQSFWRCFRRFGLTRIVFRCYRNAGLTRENMLTVRYLDFDSGLVPALEK